MGMPVGPRTTCIATSWLPTHIRRAFTPLAAMLAAALAAPFWRSAFSAGCQLGPSPARGGPLRKAAHPLESTPRATTPTIEPTVRFIIVITPAPLAVLDFAIAKHMTEAGGRRSHEGRGARARPRAAPDPAAALRRRSDAGGARGRAR